MQRTPSLWLQASAAAVHLYTASGAVLAFLIALAAIRGDAVQALWLLLGALIIDSTDGSLARRLRVSEILPFFDGRRLDDIVDYLTFVFVPVLLLYRAGDLPPVWGGVPATLVLLSSAYGFCRTDAKTEDNFFTGFPSYWNIVAIYLGLLDRAAGPWPGALLVVALTVLTVLPVRFVYPNLAPRPWKAPTLVGALVWLALLVLILLRYDAPPPWVVWLSLVYPAYYLALSVVLDAKARAARRPEFHEPPR